MIELAEITNFVDKTFKIGLEILKAKNSDYATGDDPYKNFKRISNYDLSVELGFIVRMSDKVSRIENLTTKEAAVKNEKIEDTLLDLINYSNLFISYIQTANLEDERPFLEKLETNFNNYSELFIQRFPLDQINDLKNQFGVEVLAHLLDDSLARTAKDFNIAETQIENKEYIMWNKFIIGNLIELIHTSTLILFILEK